MRISVIIPAFNEEKLIKRCIQSLRDQTFSKNNFEIIVIDNGSTDKTPEIAKAEGVKVLIFTKNHTVAAVRNYGASQSNAEIVTFMDADSLPSRDWLESINSAFLDSKLVAVGGVALPAENILYIRIMFALYNELLRLNQLAGIVLLWGFNLAIKKSAFDEVHGFDENLTAYEDAEIGLRLQKRFGKKSVLYSQKLKVYTSTRKQRDFYQLFLYITDTVKNYINVVILKRSVVTHIRNLR